MRSVCCRKHKQNNVKSDNRGFTLVELVVTFALLGIFLVSVTRIISYTVTLYHETQGTALGIQVSDMIAARVQGSIEDANRILDGWHYAQLFGYEVPNEGFNYLGDKYILFQDGNGVIIKIFKEETDAAGNGIIVIRNNEIKDDEGNVLYEQHDWKFDEKAYMGYKIKDINFAFAQSKISPDYGSDVIYMTLTLHSDRYGDYSSEYFIKASKVQ